MPGPVGYFFSATEDLCDSPPPQPLCARTAPPPFGSISLKSFGWWLFESAGHSGMPCSECNKDLSFMHKMLIKIFTPHPQAAEGKTW